MTPYEAFGEDLDRRGTEVFAIAEPFNGPRSVDTEALIRRVADTLHRLNQQIERAVEAGITVEVMRGSRIHNGRGQWGDQMIPVVRVSDTHGA